MLSTLLSWRYAAEAMITLARAWYLDCLAEIRRTGRGQADNISNKEALSRAANEKDCPGTLAASDGYRSNGCHTHHPYGSFYEGLHQKSHLRRLMSSKETKYSRSHAALSWEVSESLFQGHIFRTNVARRLWCRNHQLRYVAGGDRDRYIRMCAPGD